MQIKPFFDARTYTLTYLVWDEATLDAMVIDSVLDYDPIAVKTFDQSLQDLMAFIDAENLKLRWVFETHAHADHLSGSQVLKDKYGARVAIGAAITDVQDVFKGLFNLPSEFKTDGSQFDKLLSDGEVVHIGSMAVRALSTPGHTPACMSFQVGDVLFTGDALFMPDFGTGRCDFPAGSAADMYHSVHDKLYALPDETRVFVGHDYQPNGRELRWETTIGESKRTNKHLKIDTAEGDFVALRSERDQSLNAPVLLYQSVQVNVAAGQLPDPEGNGIRYLKLPMVHNG
ncbi:MAG: MBL fold metallo-hydrolase [Myxococcales bacterium]|nr:MBL fold metallo-hydrolase [Myxococcales bacterium]